MSFKVPERYRITVGKMGSEIGSGNNGAFTIPVGTHSSLSLNVIASDGLGWEHVSVSTPHRAPTWAEMCIIKSLFWDQEDCVVQYHPPESDYINTHPYCLHLWRQEGIEFPRPPSFMVG